MSVPLKYMLSLCTMATALSVIEAEPCICTDNGGRGSRNVKIPGRAGNSLNTSTQEAH